MVTIFILVGLLFFISGLLSIANISDIGLNFVSQTKIHQLPFLNTFLSDWVYLAVGLLILAIAIGLYRRK